MHQQILSTCVSKHKIEIFWQNKRFGYYSILILCICKKKKKICSLSTINILFIKISSNTPILETHKSISDFQIPFTYTFILDD